MVLRELQSRLWFWLFPEEARLLKLHSTELCLAPPVRPSHLSTAQAPCERVEHSGGKSV